MVPQQIEALLKFLPKIDSLKPIGKLVVTKFEKALYRHGWIDSDLDGGEWSEAEEYVLSPEKLDTADVVVVRKLLTTHFRKERYCEGHLNAMFANGHITSLLRRLQALRTCHAFD